MGRQGPDFACITLLCGHWFDRNEAFVVVWVVDLDCWRLQRDKGKRSTQPRVAAMAKQHGQMTIVEIGDAAAEIAGLSTTPRSNVYALAIAVHPSMGRQTHRYAAFVAPRSDADFLRGAFSRMRAEKPQSRRHSTAISASSCGIWRTRAPPWPDRPPQSLRPGRFASAVAHIGVGSGYV